MVASHWIPQPTWHQQFNMQCLKLHFFRVAQIKCVMTKEDVVIFHFFNYYHAKIELTAIIQRKFLQKMGNPFDIVIGKQCKIHLYLGLLINLASLLERLIKH
uniref:Uncharacterized protein n=1 Tax=Lutzomyia longipalpis TaxID=7200 RepID=A0A1B0CAJ4_LUTLO